jgi:hypothetical protein
VIYNLEDRFIYFVFLFRFNQCCGVLQFLEVVKRLVGKCNPDGNSTDMGVQLLDFRLIRPETGRLGGFQLACLQRTVTEGTALKFANSSASR